MSTEAARKLFRYDEGGDGIDVVPEMQGSSLIRNMPTRLLHLCKDLELIDDYAITQDQVMIRQGTQTRLYSPLEAATLLDTMLEAAPTLKRIASQLPGMEQGRSSADDRAQS